MKHGLILFCYRSSNLCSCDSFSVLIVADLRSVWLDDRLTIRTKIRFQEQNLHVFICLNHYEVIIIHEIIFIRVQKHILCSDPPISMLIVLKDRSLWVDCCRIISRKMQYSEQKIYSVVFIDVYKLPFCIQIILHYFVDFRTIFIKQIWLVFIPRQNWLTNKHIQFNETLREKKLINFFCLQKNIFFSRFYFTRKLPKCCV